MKQHYKEKPKKRTRCAIGIDPAKGIAVWNCTEKKYEIIETTDFWEICERLRRWNEHETNPINPEIFVVIETPQGNSPVWISIPNVKDPAKRKAAEIKAAQDVGRNKCKSELIIELCDILKIKCIQQTPTKGSFTKLDAKQFESMTGWKKRTSEHGRDAAMLVYQM